MKSREELARRIATREAGEASGGGDLPLQLSMPAFAAASASVSSSSLLQCRWRNARRIVAVIPQATPSPQQIFRK